MRTHLCNITGDWAEGTVSECCANHYGRTQLNRSGYQDSTRVRKGDAPPGSPDVRHRDHYSGRVDAKVREPSNKFTLSRSELRKYGS